MVEITMTGIDSQITTNNDINNPLHMTISFRIEIIEVIITNNLNPITTNQDQTTTILHLDMNNTKFQTCNHILHQIKTYQTGRKQ